MVIKIAPNLKYNHKRGTVMPEQLIIEQTIEGQAISRKCNAALLVYTNGHVVLQKNIKGNTQWASVGGKVDVKDKAAITDFAHHDGLERKLIDFLRDQFKADKDPIIATFAYAALREAVEEIGGNNNKFIYESILNKKATLVRINRDSFGISEADKNFWTEQFYIDFSGMSVEELMTNLKASGEKDCQEIIAAPVVKFQTKPSIKQGVFVTTYNDGTSELEVRHTVGVIARRIHALRERIAATSQITTNELLHSSFTKDDPLIKADLGTGLSRIFLPQGKANEPANWVVVLGKRFNGQLKLSVGGAVDPKDNSFYEAAIREGKEEQFGQLPVTSETDCIAHDINFKPKSGKPDTDGMLYYAFMAIETKFTTEQITTAIANMNRIAPVYFAINNFLTKLSKATVEDRKSDTIKQEAKQLLSMGSSLEWGYKLQESLHEELSYIAKGIVNLNGEDLIRLAEKHVRIYSEYSFFTQVPYLQYMEALQSKDKFIQCTNHTGQVERVALFNAEIDAVLGFMREFEAKRLKMLKVSPTLQFSTIVASTRTPLANIDNKISRSKTMPTYELGEINREFPGFKLDSHDGIYITTKNGEYLDPFIAYRAKDANDPRSWEQKERLSDIVALFTLYGKDCVSMSLDFIGSLMGYTLSEYSDQHGVETAEELEKYSGKLQILDLAGCNIDDEGMIKILNAIMHNPILAQQLKVLRIPNNNLGIKSLQLLINDVLPTCKNLIVQGLTGQGLGAVDSGRGVYDTSKNVETNANTATLVSRINALCQERFKSSANKNSASKSSASKPKLLPV